MRFLPPEERVAHPHEKDEQNHAETQTPGDELSFDWLEGLVRDLRYLVGDFRLLNLRRHDGPLFS